MSPTIRIYDPEAKPKVIQSRAAPALSDLKGRTIGVIDNGFHSFGTAIPRLEKLLQERQQVASFIVTRKPWLTRPLSPEAFQSLVSRADAVIVGLGN